MEVIIEGIKAKKENAFGIPVLFIEPEDSHEKKLVIFLGGLGSTKESLITYLRDIANKGFYALAFDNYEHGERGSEIRSELTTRVFSNMRKYGWKILGETALDTVKVMDWAVKHLQVIPQIRMGGISMGGDISIAASGIDPRIIRIAPIITTPDWLRPEMHEITNPNVLMDPGKSDKSSQALYDRLNPMTHIERYIDCPKIRAVLGEHDTHIPPENLERFKKELGKISKKAMNNIEITYIKGVNSNHRDVTKRKNEWWQSLLEWLVE